MHEHAFNSGVWTGIAVGILGVLISAIGLTVAVVQLKRIKRTADAVAEAVKAQRDDISDALLLSRTGDLERIESELRGYFRLDEPMARQLATQAVLSWRRFGIDFQALTKRQSLPPAKLVEAMAESLAVVSVALQDLSDGQITVQDACHSLLAKMSVACEQAREATGAMILPGP